MCAVLHTSARHMRHTVILHHPHRTRIGPHGGDRLARAAIGRLVRSRTDAASDILLLLWVVHQVLRLLLLAGLGLLRVVGGKGLELDLGLGVMRWRGAIGVRIGDWVGIGIGNEGCTRSRRRRVCRAIAVSRCIHPERLWLAFLSSFEGSFVPITGRLAWRGAVIGQAGRQEVRLESRVV